MQITPELPYLETRILLIENGTIARYDKARTITPMLTDRWEASNIIKYCCSAMRDKKERSLDIPGAVHKRETRAAFFPTLRKVFLLSFCISIILFLYGYAKIYLLFSGPFRKHESVQKTG